MMATMTIPISTSQTHRSFLFSFPFSPLATPLLLHTLFFPTHAFLSFLSFLPSKFESFTTPNLNDTCVFSPTTQWLLINALI